MKTSTIKTRELAHRKLDCFRAIDQGARLVEQKLPSFGHDNAAFHTIEQFVPNSGSSDAIAADTEGGASPRASGARVTCSRSATAIKIYN